MTTKMLVGVTLAAITLADILAARFGASVSVLNSLWLIGLVIVTRDRLHDLWEGHALALRLGLLIAAGGFLAWLVSIVFATAPPGIARDIALGSMFAFAAAETVDAVTYHLLRERAWMVRSNGSNLPAAAVDSVVFAWIAFGDPLGVGTAQLVAKVIGGLFWSWVIGRTLVSARNTRSENLAEA